jgi:putative sigma-54 modulation protein
MQITISAKNTEITDAIRNYVEKKIGRLERKIDNIISADVVLSVEKYRHIANVRLNVSGEILKAEESSKDMYSSIDLIYEVLEKQIEKFKDKMRSKKRGASEEAFSATSETTSREPVIVEEEFIPKPLSIEEAMIKLDEDDKHFIVFNSSENGKVCVLYKKKNGDFGYIVTR